MNDPILPVEAVPIPPAPPAPRKFGAGKAILSLGVVLLLQIIAGIVVAVVCVAIRGPHVATTRDGMREIAAPILIGSGLASVAGTALAIGLWAKELARNRTPEGLGLFLPSTAAMVGYGAAGLAIAGSFIALTQVVEPDPSMLEESFMAQAVAAGGLARLSWAIFAVVFAPLYEEILFRGLVWKGLAASWGKWPAGILVTAIFTGLHYSEIKDYWPAIASIGTLAVVTLAARIRTGSLAPAVAVHFVYNGSMVALAYLQG